MCRWHLWAWSCRTRLDKSRRWKKDTGPWRSTKPWVMEHGWRMKPVSSNTNWISPSWVSYSPGSFSCGFLLLSFIYDCHILLALFKKQIGINMPAPSKGCCLNPKGWCFLAPLIIHETHHLEDPGIRNIYLENKHLAVDTIFVGRSISAWIEQFQTWHHASAPTPLPTPGCRTFLKHLEIWQRPGTAWHHNQKVK